MRRISAVSRRRLAVLALLVWVWPTHLLAQTMKVDKDPGGPFVGQAELSFHLLRHIDDPSHLLTTTGIGLRGGYRPGESWTFLFGIERNDWNSNDRDKEVNYSTLNMGPGIEYCYFDCLARTSLMMGMTVLLSDTEVDSPGKPGLFIDARPGAFRWPIFQRTWLILDPLSFVLMIPVMDRIPLIVIEFRTSVTMEYRF